MAVAIRLRSCFFSAISIFEADVGDFDACADINGLSKSFIWEFELNHLVFPPRRASVRFYKGLPHPNESPLRAAVGSALDAQTLAWI
jgi:hypothetical protein